MKAKSAKLLSLVLALMLAFSMAACGNGGGGNNNTDEDENIAAKDWDLPEFPELVYDDEGELDEDSYDERSAAIYNYVLKDFVEAYAPAQAETNVSKRYALMAMAEAKLMESGVMLPTKTRGGNYAITRIVPYTVDNVLWGTDNDRFHNALVVSGDPIAKEDITHLRTMYEELKGTGTYAAQAKAYLAGKGRTFTDVYNYAYSSDPQTWDALATSRAADSEAIVNTYDGLLEYDNEGIQQPALAESYTVSDDGTKYTFKIRDGVKWVDSQGRYYADVTAKDFVSAFHHLLDSKSGLDWLVSPVIKGANEYLKSSTKDFSVVGVTCDEEANTVTYELTGVIPYFPTMLGYNIFAPMNEDFFFSKGGKYGTEFNKAAEDYTYGSNPDSILYCGPYTVTSLTAKNAIVFSANDSYWNADNITIKTINWKYNDGKDVMKAYNDMKAETISGAGLNANSLEQSKKDTLDSGKTWFEAYAYVSNTDATSFMNFFNVDRNQYANVQDATAAVSLIKGADRDNTNLAMKNVHFRRAVMFAVDRASYIAQSTGDELKYNSMRNCYTPGNFVYTSEPVTVTMNGTEKTYPANTAYGQIMQDQLDADGVGITVWTNKNISGSYSSDGFDGDVSLAVGLDPEGRMNGIAFTELNETPGMGMLADEPAFKDQFTDRDVTQFVHNKGGVTGDNVIDAISGASTTSGAVVNAVNAGLDFFHTVMGGN